MTLEREGGASVIEVWRGLKKEFNFNVERMRLLIMADSRTLAMVVHICLRADFISLLLGGWVLQR